MEVQRKTFSQLLLEAIDEGLRKTFEAGTAKSVKFYVDPNIAVKNPELYAKLIQKIFGEGATIILERIIEQIAAKFRFEKTAGMSFEEAVGRARTERLKHLNPNTITEGTQST